MLCHSGHTIHFHQFISLLFSLVFAHICTVACHTGAEFSRAGFESPKLQKYLRCILLDAMSLLCLHAIARTLCMHRVSAIDWGCDMCPVFITILILPFAYNSQIVPSQYLPLSCLGQSRKCCTLAFQCSYHVHGRNTISCKVLTKCT